MTNRKNTSRALVASALAVLLCVSMLVGSTFAWFTDNATTNVNKIESGTLKIDLVDKDGNSLKDKYLDFIQKGENKLWEPGSTWELQPIHIKNNGTLALKYQIAITGIQGDAELNKAIDWTIQMDGKDFELNETEFELLAGDKSPALTIKGHMKEEAGNEFMGKTIDGIAITVYARQHTYEHDSEDDQYDKNSVYAKPWQNEVEDTDIPPVQKDDEGNEVVKISTAEQLAAFAYDVNVKGNTYAGKTVQLTQDIDLAGGAWTPIGQTGATQFLGTFDGQGHTISNLYIDSSAQTGGNYSTGLFGWIERHGSDADYLMAVKNLKVNSANVKGNHNVAVIAGYLIGTIENCHVTNATVLCTHANDDACGDKAGVIAGIAAESSALIKGCTATDSTVTAGRDAGQIVGAFLTNPNNVIDCSATNVTVSATGDCNGNNIKNALIGRTE